MIVIFSKVKNSILTFTLMSVYCILFSCSNSSRDEKKISSIKLNTDNDESLKRKLLDGDTTAYFQLRQSYVMKDKPVDFLFWALIMANKFHFKTAYYDVFFCVEQVNRYYGTYSKQTKTYSNSLDSITDEFARKYLNKLADTNLINETLEFYKKDTSRIEY